MGCPGWWTSQFVSSLSKDFMLAIYRWLDCRWWIRLKLYQLSPYLIYLRSRSVLSVLTNRNSKNKANSTILSFFIDYPNHQPTVLRLYSVLTLMNWCICFDKEHSHLYKICKCNRFSMSNTNPDISLVNLLPLWYSSPPLPLCS